MNIIQSISVAILLMAMACISGNAYSAEITTNKYTIMLRGEIKKGDFEAVTKALVNSETYPNYLTVESPGGNVYEATKIGTLIRELAMGVVVDKTCNSACFFILAAGVYRSANDAVIGIHRPFYEKELFAGLPLSEAEIKYRELEQRSRNYLKAMGVPTAIVEKMFLMASDEAHNLTENERAFLSKNSFAYDEWIKAKCEPLTPKEREDYNPFDQFDEHPEKNYSSAGHYEYLQKKYDRYDECVKKAKYETRQSILKQYK